MSDLTIFKLRIALMLILLSGCSVRGDFRGITVNSGLDGNYTLINEIVTYKKVSKRNSGDWVYYGGYKFKFDIVRFKDRYALKVKVGEQVTYNSGYVKYKRIEHEYRNNWSWPKKTFRKFIKEEEVEDVNGPMVTDLERVDTEAIEVRIYGVGMRGVASPDKNNEVLIDLLEPALLSEGTRDLTVKCSTIVKYKESVKRSGGYKRVDRRKRITSEYVITKNILAPMIEDFKRAKNNNSYRVQYISDAQQALMDAKYYYDQYGNLKMAKEFIEDIETNKRLKSRRIRGVKKLPLRVPIRVPHPIGILVGLLIDAALSSDSEVANVTFLHNPD